MLFTTKQAREAEFHLAEGYGRICSAKQARKAMKHRIFVENIVLLIDLLPVNETPEILGMSEFFLSFGVLV